MESAMDEVIIAIVSGVLGPIMTGYATTSEMSSARKRSYAMASALIIAFVAWFVWLAVAWPVGPSESLEHLVKLVAMSIGGTQVGYHAKTVASRGEE